LRLELLLTSEVSPADYEARYKAWQERRSERIKLTERLREEGRELYETPPGPTLRDSIAAFVDELGFSVRVKNLSNEDLRRDIGIYDDARARLSNPLVLHDEELRVLFFSDNVGLAKPVGADYPANDLLGVLLLLADYQLNMTLNDRFVRGGVTRGDLYADNSWITGDALVQAYELESKTAVYPRVLIDEGCQALAMDDFAPHDPLFFLNRLSDAQNLLLRDGDRVILSYLGLLLLDEYIDLPVDAALAAHRRQIMSNLSQDRGRHINEKYEWVAAYHDFFVTQVIWYPEYVIGRRHNRHFASFNVSWMSDLLGPSPATLLLVRNFEKLCAEMDAVAAAEVVEPVDQEAAQAENGPLLRSIEYNCRALLAADGVDNEDTATIEKVVAASRVVVSAARAPQPVPVDQVVTHDMTDCLWVLDKGLRILRIDPRSSKVASTGLALASEHLSD
jgi:hypothetical protein